MRVNTANGGWCCMACGVRGGDVLSYRMAAYGEDFISAAKALDCWAADGRPAPTRPTPLPARDALALLAHESNLVAISAANISNGVALSTADLARVLIASGRITKVTEAFL
jgi:hypothetical protein